MSALGRIGKNTVLHGALIRRGVPEPTAQMAAVAMQAPQWERFTEAFIDRCDRQRFLQTGTLVIGGGFHGTTFSLNYRAPDRLTLFCGRLGGIFGAASQPVFYLNSRTRRGDLATPGESGTLNFIPGGSLQPADISGEEYPSQDVMAKCITLNLDQCSAVRQVLSPVVAVYRYPNDKQISVEFASGGVVMADRVVVATGLCEPPPPLCDDPRVVSFPQFLEDAGRQMFPLRDYNRVAVIGAGDSGKVVVEFLLGQGPRTSPAALDYVEHIDWFGVPDEVTTGDDWERCNRSRYKGIGRYLPRPPYSYARVFAFDKAQSVVVRDGNLYVQHNGVYAGPFDHVIDCRGFVNTAEKLLAPFGRPLEPFEGIARKVYGEEVYVVGPAAQLPVTALERERTPALRGIKENVASMFRYAPWTARLARLLSERK